MKINIDQCDSSDKKNKMNNNNDISKVNKLIWESLLDSGKSEPAWEDEDQLVTSSVEENSPSQFMGVD